MNSATTTLMTSHNNVGKMTGKMSDGKKRVIGVIGAITAGLLFGTCFNPAQGTVRVFRQNFALEDQANMCVANGIFLGSPLALTVATINHAETLKASQTTLSKTFAATSKRITRIRYGERFQTH
jgi:hypothetical protein